MPTNACLPADDRSEMSQLAGLSRNRRGHLAVLGCACLLALATCGTNLSGDLAGDTQASSESGAPADPGQADAPALPSLPNSEPVDGRGPPIGQGGASASAAGNATETVGDEETDGDDSPTIETEQPTVRLTGDEPATEDPVGAARDVDGVRSATAIRVGQLPIAPKEGPTTVKAASVSLEEFRVFTPPVTAEATEVWDRLEEGDLAFTHDTGQQLGLELGERVPAGGENGRVRVGAFASNGIPPVADVIMSHEAANEIGFDGDLQILVSLDDKADGDAVARKLGETTGLKPEPIVPPEMQQASEQQTGQTTSSVPARSQQIEPFSYQSIGDGMIRIESSWVRRNIVSANVPVLPGAVRCHRAMIPQLRAALAEIAERGLADLIRSGDYGGCWTPRHIMFNPQRNLSMHAWGLAIDLNVSTNGYGAQPQMDPRIVEVFQKWGFEWGGHWSTPDGMHFELRTLMDVPG